MKAESWGVEMAGLRDCPLEKRSVFGKIWLMVDLWAVSMAVLRAATKAETKAANLAC